MQAEAEQVPAAARAETEAVRQRTCQMEKKAAALFGQADRQSKGSVGARADTAAAGTGKDGACKGTPA